MEGEKLAITISNEESEEEQVLSMFCGCERAIPKHEADLHGLNWNEYCAHPDKLKMCWPCKEGSLSVISEKTALLKFNKKLNTTTVSNTGFEYYPFFTFLQSKGRCFHQTVHNKETTYFWFPNFEMEALSLGWRPRGKRNQQGVPWVQKDLSAKREEVTMLKSSPRESRKRNKPIEIDDSIDLTVNSDSKRNR